MTEPSGSTPRRKGPSLRKSVMMDTWRGVPRVRAWPKDRGPAKSEPQRRSQELFKAASDLMKLTPSVVQIPTIEATAGTPFYPRDLMMMAMFGRLWAMMDRQGRFIRTKAMNQDVSKSLDTISDEPGTILVRGPEGWIGAFNAGGFATNYPTRIQTTGPGSLSSSAFAFKGAAFRCEQGGDLFGASYWCNWVAGATYVAVACELDSSNVVQAVTTSDEFSPLTNGQYWHSFGLGMELNQNTTYTVMLGRTDAAGNYPLPVPFPSNGWINGPIELQGSRRFVGTSVQIGDTLDNNGGSGAPVYHTIRVAI